MKFGKKKVLDKITLAFVPLLPFLVLIAPYSFLSQVVIVNLLGCSGTNIFTIIFWILIGVGDIILSIFLVKKIIKENKAFTIAYIVIAAVLIILLTYFTCSIMMFK